jgi:hypothetical protein
LKDIPEDHAYSALKEVTNQLHKLIVLISDLSGGLLKLGDVCNVNNPPRFDNFEMFLSNMICYGSGYYDSKDYQTPFVHENQR